MAHFYVSTENSRGNQVTASGSKSGQTTHCRGWNGGVEVWAHVDDEGRDIFDIFRTGGSNGGARRFIGAVIADEFVPAERTGAL